MNEGALVFAKVFDESADVFRLCGGTGTLGVELIVLKLAFPYAVLADIKITNVD